MRENSMTAVTEPSRILHWLNYVHRSILPCAWKIYFKCASIIGDLSIFSFLNNKTFFLRLDFYIYLFPSLGRLHCLYFSTVILCTHTAVSFFQYFGKWAGIQLEKRCCSVTKMESSEGKCVELTFFLTGVCQSIYGCNTGPLQGGMRALGMGLEIY